MKRLVLIILVCIIALGTGFVLLKINKSNEVSVIISENIKNASESYKVLEKSKIFLEDLFRIEILKIEYDKNAGELVQNEVGVINDQKTIQSFVDELLKASHKPYFLDRSPSTHTLHLYFKDGKKITAEYWLNCELHNISLRDVVGYFTVDSKKVDKLILNAINNR